jgi:hypothetical protein
MPEARHRSARGVAMCAFKRDGGAACVRVGGRPSSVISCACWRQTHCGSLAARLSRRSPDAIYSDTKRRINAIPDARVFDAHLLTTPHSVRAWNLERPGEGQAQGVESASSPARPPARPPLPRSPLPGPVPHAQTRGPDTGVPSRHESRAKRRAGSARASTNCTNALRCCLRSSRPGARARRRAG